ncbi:MAG: formate--tetrahydrofolate ligase, partial [Armatimonadetes bacterium]|nr:formate--tetrahydrofolate ligase [Armatimonadota bacterium]
MESLPGPLPIAEVASRLGLAGEDLLSYGPYKAKVLLSTLERLGSRPSGKYIGVTAITPTPLGEGKTVTTIGLGMALNRLGHQAMVCIRQPAMGPVFGVKGGDAGGGRSQLVPFEDINLHFTGDMQAVSMAHNLLAAFIDSHLRHGNALDIDPLTIAWGRVMDMNDAALRQIVVGMGGRRNGIPRESYFDTTAASEVMAILALSRDIKDLRARLGRITVAMTRSESPVSAEDLGCAGAMAALLKDALHPNLAQTAEGTPAFVHAGPFGNIAHGNSSIVADKLALKLADFVVTESGFGADLGAEKFFNIKCRYSGLTPDAMVLVCTVRAIKVHSGRYKIVTGRPLDPALLEEDMLVLREGVGNLEKQIENVRLSGVPVVLAVNRFPPMRRRRSNICATLPAPRAQKPAASAMSGPKGAGAAW